jgi:hypothetical protein
VVLFTLKEERRDRLGEKPSTNCFFGGGRHDGRRAGDSNFVLLGVACKKDSHGRLAANQDHVEMARLGCGSGIIMSRSMHRRRWATSYDDG